MKKPLFLKIIICIILCLALGIASGFIGGSPLSDWYQALNKPFFQPPPWIFGPAWTLLYTLMGIAIAMIWNLSYTAARKKAIRLFVIQFVLNFVWSPVFFGLQIPMIALVIILSLWIMIVITIRHFYSLKKLAAYLLVPYLLWVSFATVLNATIVYLN